jgi:hypothetical protein
VIVSNDHVRVERIDAGADSLVRCFRGAGQHRHKRCTGAKDRVRLQLSAVDRLCVRKHPRFGEHFTHAGDRRDAQAFEQRGSDLNDIRERPQVFQKVQMLGLIEGDLKQHGVLVISG